MFAIFSQQAWAPPKNKVFPSSWLSQFDLHGFDEKQGSMHLMFHCNETLDLNWCLKLLYPHFTFCTPNFTCQGVQKPPVKNFSGHTADILIFINCNCGVNRIARQYLDILIFINCNYCVNRIARQYLDKLIFINCYRGVNRRSRQYLDILVFIKPLPDNKF